MLDRHKEYVNRRILEGKNNGVAPPHELNQRGRDGSYSTGKRVAATTLFTLVSARYEKGSIILTSNKRFAEGKT